MKWLAWKNVRHERRPKAPEVAALLQRPEDLALLDHLRHDDGFCVIVTMRVEELLKVLTNHTVAVVIIDRNLAGKGWRDVVQRASQARGWPCVMLASTVSDRYLWNEVVRNGGYDVVTEPLREEEALEKVRLAYNYWSAGATLRDQRLRK
jgi:DNA-binding response OmpR family regulator